MTDGMSANIITIPRGAVFYHGTACHLRKDGVFTSFDMLDETYVTQTELAAEFFSGDLEDPTSSPVVIKLVANRDIMLLDTPTFCGVSMKVDGYTRKGTVRKTIDYDDTMLLDPNIVLTFVAYKSLSRKGVWSPWNPLP